MSKMKAPYISTRTRGKNALLVVGYPFAISRILVLLNGSVALDLQHYEPNNAFCFWKRRDFVGLATLGLVTLEAPSPGAAMSTDPKSGIVLPDEGEIEGAIPFDWSGVENPFLNADPSNLFGRLDSSPDSIFYTDPRFVEHVDDNAVKIMTKYISQYAIVAGGSILDLCSSWTSHIDPSRVKDVRRIVGLGMNEKELEANVALTEWRVQDLNSIPRLPYENASFDAVLCQLSIDYLTKPLEIMSEVGRVLKPGGKVHILFSNRLFLSKAVGLWTGADDVDHAYYVGCYLRFCGGSFGNIYAKDLSNRKGKRVRGDPVYVVVAEKE